MVRTERIQLMNEDGMLPPYRVICYYHEIKAQYYHLRASMLAYAHINLLTMLPWFNKNDVPRVATDSLYVRPRSAPKDAPILHQGRAGGVWAVEDKGRGNKAMACARKV